ncbi:YDG domain-containing protein, partial [Clostridioides difficile]|uniref:YDG domain-containing protein n=1 Tax=Clostridioides difficile TaxID=1496 RepID=UPI0029C4B56D
SNYQLAATSINANVGTITPADLTVSNITANNKAYDGNTSATLNTGAAQLHGVLGSDIVTLNSSDYIANFANANIGDNLAVTVTNLGLNGASASNYSLIQPTGITANITAPIVPPTPTAAASSEIPYNAVAPAIISPLNSTASQGSPSIQITETPATLSASALGLSEQTANAMASHSNT